jgi:CBS domain-containing protein
MNVSTILKEKGQNVITADSSLSLLDVAKILSEKGIGSIVIIDTGKKVAGILSERDIVRSLAKAGSDALTQPVSLYMTQKVVTCNCADTIDTLMSKMTSGRFRHMPVVENDELVGIVSIGDVVKQRIAQAEMETAAMRDYIATG